MSWKHLPRQQKDVVVTGTNFESRFGSDEQDQSTAVRIGGDGELAMEALA